MLAIAGLIAWQAASVRRLVEQIVMWVDVPLFVAIGFAAQLIDGAIGMAYGVIAASVLISLGMTPATASASVHAAEVFTTACSGLAHWRVGNVIWGMVWRLAIPGVIGGAIGAWLLVSIPAEIVRPIVSAYLLAMGVLILWRAVRYSRDEPRIPRGVALLGLAGGFLDAVGGGGWGAVVTSTLIARRMEPRFAIGSVSVAEFFVTMSITATFVATIGLSLWPIIVGLVLGGALAAPLAALAARKLPERPIMVLVGTVVTLLSLRNLLTALV